MSKIKSITVTCNNNKPGKLYTIDIDSSDENVRGVEAIQILNEAISMILNEIV